MGWQVHAWRLAALAEELAFRAELEKSAGSALVRAVLVKPFEKTATPRMFTHPAAMKMILAELDVMCLGYQNDTTPFKRTASPI